MIIVITRPEFFEGEAEGIVQLLDSGRAHLVHIRKPSSSLAEVEQLLKKLPNRLYYRLVLHDHHELAVRYGLRGVHLNHRNPVPPQRWQGAVSRSCHSLEELAACLQEPYAYLSLSPIFDSISKQGYQAAFTAAELAAARKQGLINERVMALGGVTFSRIDEVKRMGFGGAMILGDAWKM